MEIIKIAAAIILKKAAFTSSAAGGASSRPTNSIATAFNRYDPTIQDEGAAYNNRRSVMESIVNNPAFTGNRTTAMSRFNDNVYNSPAYQTAMAREAYRGLAQNITEMRRLYPDLNLPANLPYNQVLGNWMPEGYTRQDNEFAPYAGEKDDLYSAAPYMS